MTEATVTSKGQITIPADVRKDLDLAPGSKVVFTRLGNGATVIRAKTRSALDLAGSLKPARKRKVPVADMNIGRD